MPAKISRPDQDVSSLPKRSPPLPDQDRTRRKRGAKQHVEAAAHPLLGQAGRGTHAQEQQSQRDLKHAHDRDHFLIPGVASHDLSDSTIQRMPRAEYRIQTTRNNRDGFDRCHSRHRTGLPSSDGPGSVGRHESVGKCRENRPRWAPGRWSAGLLQGHPSNSERRQAQEQRGETETNAQEPQVGHQSDLAGIRVGCEGEVVRIRALDPFPESRRGSWQEG